MSIYQNPSESRIDKSARLSVSFPRDIYEIIEQIAKKKKVSVAWVIRDAVEKYIADQWPIFEQHEKQ